MAPVTQVPRSRGGVSGVLLILLGAWGGLAPFIGSYLHFGFTPDKAWAWTSGRLWLSIVPGAAALLGGLLAASASHRGVGVTGAFLAVLGGAWFVVGVPIIAIAVKSGSITPGNPLGGTLGSLSVSNKALLEELGLFTGVGALILFLAATALGRFSVVGVRDMELAQAEDGLDGGSGGSMEHDMGYPSNTGQFTVTGTAFPRSSETGQLRGPGS
jgi:hypothetical protein